MDGESTRATVIKIVGSVFRNRDALLTLARLKSYDEYALYHSLNIAVLTLHLGASLGIRQDELLRLGGCPRIGIVARKWRSEAKLA